MNPTGLCEVRIDATQQHCPAVAEYWLQWGVKRGFVCGGCLAGWVRQLADDGNTVAVRRLTERRAA